MIIIYYLDINEELSKKISRLIDGGKVRCDPLHDAEPADAHPMMLHERRATQRCAGWGSSG